jgi:hypothetical protein
MATLFDTRRVEGAITPTQPSPIKGEGFDGQGGTLPLDGGGQGGGDAPDPADKSIAWAR